MKKTLFIPLLVFALSSCAQKPKNMDTTLVSDFYKEVKYRDQSVNYHAGIAVGGCAFEFFVNDMPIEQYYGSGNGTFNTSAPINDNILKSGTQTWRLEVYPAFIKGVQTDTLSAGIETNITIKTLQFYEGGVRDLAPKFSLIETPKRRDEQGQMAYQHAGKEKMVYSGTFQARVPYELTGWSQSVDLRKENQKKLLEEVVQKYEEIIALLKEKDAQKLAELVYKKNKEYAQAIFLNKKLSAELWEAHLKIITTPSLQLQPLEQYQMKIYAEGRVVTLERTDYPNIGESALRSKYTNEDGRKRVGFYYFKLHRPTPGAKLEVIR